MPHCISKERQSDGQNAGYGKERATKKQWDILYIMDQV